MIPALVIFNLVYYGGNQPLDNLSITLPYIQRSSVLFRELRRDHTNETNFGTCLLPSGNIEFAPQEDAFESGESGVVRWMAAKRSSRRGWRRLQPWLTTYLHITVSRPPKGYYISTVG